MNEQSWENKYLVVYENAETEDTCETVYFAERDLLRRYCQQKGARSALIYNENFERWLIVYRDKVLWGC